MLGGFMTNNVKTAGIRTTQITPKCPKCRKYYVGYPALSREDNETEICPECGVKEAILCYLRNRKPV